MTNKKNSGLLGKMIVPVVLSTFLYGCSSGGGGGGSSSSNNNGGDPVDPVYSCSATEKSTLDGLGLYQVPGLENKGSTEVSTSVSIDNGVNNYSALASCLADSQGGNVTISSEVITTSCDEGFQSNENQCEAIIQTPLNCEAGIFTSNGIDFGYDAFNHGETQNVSNTQKGTYENTTSTDTLGCDDGVVSSQGNFNQTTTENELGVTLTSQYLSQELGYTQITDDSVTPEFWDVNSTNELSFIKPLGDYSIFQTTGLTPSYVVVLENAPAQTKPHTSEGEYSQSESFLTSQITPTQNESNISQVITYPTNKSGIEAKISQIASNLAEGIRGAMYSFVSTLDPRTNTEQAKILTDGVDYTISLEEMVELIYTN